MTSKQPIHHLCSVTVLYNRCQLLQLDEERETISLNLVSDVLTTYHEYDEINDISQVPHCSASVPSNVHDETVPKQPLVAAAAAGTNRLVWQGCRGYGNSNGNSHGYSGDSVGIFEADL